MRIALSALLLFLHAGTMAYFIVYLLCGATDIVDGYLARKLKVTSKLGAALDSFADVL